MNPLVNHVIYVNFSLIFVLGTLLYLDKLMVCFMGNSAETFLMKNKPISERFNFLFFVFIYGFVVNFTSDGHTASKKVI